MQTILAFLLLLTCVFARPQHSPPIKTCDVPNPCNEPYGRCKFIEGAPRCICDNGYFGATCHIGAPCPLGQFCMPDNILCYNTDCPESKGNCLPKQKWSIVPS